MGGMKIRLGYDIIFECPQPTPKLLMLSVHPSRMPDLITPDKMTFDPPIPSHGYTDGFGNICTRIVAPAGQIRIRNDFFIADPGVLDEEDRSARQHEVADLPDEVLVYLLGSRYCDTDRLADKAWELFGNTPTGWDRVQAICDYAHDRITFDYQRASPTRTAWEGHEERYGVCRDFAHLAVTLCRCVNIPARYCTGYLGDIRIPPVPGPMDFSAWFEVYLGGRWYTRDARHNARRVGRVLMAQGRDATDVAISTSFGPNTLVQFDVISDEVAE